MPADSEAHTCVRGMCLQSSEHRHLECTLAQSSSCSALSSQITIMRLISQIYCRFLLTVVHSLWGLGGESITHMHTLSTSVLASFKLVNIGLKM